MRICLISAATIAPFALCIPVQQLGTAIVVAVAARSKECAQQFADKWNIPNVFDTYDDIINSDIVDAVYIPLPNGLHFEWAKKALEAGKHVLLEASCPGMLYSVRVWNSLLILCKETICWQRSSGH